MTKGLLLSSLFLAAVAGAGPVDLLTQKAEQAWDQRDQPGMTEAAIASWDAAVKEDYRRFDLYVPLTQACGRAYRQAKEKKEKVQWADKCRAYGELAVKFNEGTPQAHAEYGTALGQWAQVHKGLRSLGAVKEAVKNLERAVKMDPHYAQAHMVLARFYEDAPGWFSVGDKEKALEHARLAVEFGGNYVINRITLARIYSARGQKDDARKELEKALTLTAPPDAVPETKSDQAEARTMLDKLKNDPKP